jgi:hypothetical protein
LRWRVHGEFRKLEIVDLMTVPGIGLADFFSSVWDDCACWRISELVAAIGNHMNRDDM